MEKTTGGSHFICNNPLAGRTTDFYFNWIWGQGLPAEQITFSSDGQGSLPVFAADGTFLGLGVGKVTSMYREMKDAVLKDGVSLEDALKLVTLNPAKLLKLEHKGRITENADADIVLAEEGTLELVSVMAKGVFMIHEKEVLVKGTFE